VDMTENSFVGSTFPPVDDMGRSVNIRLTSDAERERRLVALRNVMAAEGISALVVAGKGDLRYRGRVLYASDVFQLTADSFVLILMQGAPIFVTTPVVGLGQAKRTAWAQDFRVSAMPGEEVAKVLADYGVNKGLIGIVGLSDAISAVHLVEFTNAAPGYQIVDATFLFEEVRRVKSPEELVNLRHTSAIFRKIFQAMEAEIRPGVLESDIAGAAARLAKLHGCRDVKVAMATTPFNAVSYGSNKRIERDSMFMLWIETPGPSGYWLELRRSYCFGRPSDEAVRYWSVHEKIWAAALDAIRPGVTGQTVLEIVADLVKANHYEISPSNYSLHGIGSDAIEGMWYPGNDKPLLEGEVVSFHPSLVFSDPAEAERLSFLGMTDNILVTANGGERLTFPRDDIRVL
jgi:Xaa-Pro aminopeptidase